MALRTVTRALLVMLLVWSSALMPVRPAAAAPFYAASIACTTSVTVTTTTETILCTSPGISTNPGQVVRIVALTDFTSGGSTTALTVRIRRGSVVTGTLVGPQDAVQTTAGNTIARSAQAEDSPGEVSGQQYVLTIQQTGAVANGTGLFSEILVLVF